MKTYIGKYNRGTGQGAVFVRDSEPRHDYELPHVVKHSPDGFAWGYGGSGPSELARCILLDFMSESVACKCGGTGRRGDLWCDGCGGEGYKLPPMLYQLFKEEHIATLPMTEGWVISGETIEKWLAGHRVQS